MKENYLKTIIFAFTIFSSVLSFAQTSFGFNSFTASGSNSSNPFEMTETVGTKTIHVNALNGATGVLITANNLSGFGGTEGNVMRTNPANRVDFIFNEAVDVVSIIALNGESADGTFTFIPTGGNGSPVNATVSGQEAQNVQIGWQGATGFSVTSSLGILSFFFDTLIINENTLTTEEFSLNTVSIHPNPTTTFINIESNSKVQNVEIYDILGKKIKSTKSKSINIETFPKGIYIMKVTTDKGIVTKKVTKL